MLYFFMGPSTINYQAAIKLESGIYCSMPSHCECLGCIREGLTSLGRVHLGTMMVSLNYFCLHDFIAGCCLLLLGRVVKGISYANVLRGSI